MTAGSTNIAIIGGPSVINGGYIPTSGPGLTGMTFTSITPADVNATTLASYDTVVLNVASSQMGCNTTALSAQAKADLVSFVGSGHKLVIYDSECTPVGGVDYSWLPFPFITSNPGAYGAYGTLAIREENTLSSTDPASAYYVDANYLSTSSDATGDANVMTTIDPHWCLDMSATNVLGVTGPVHTYATYSNAGSTTQGLFIYNGLDVDDMGYESTTNGLEKIFALEMQQTFNPVSGLPCAAPVVGIKLTPTTGTHAVGQTHTVTATLADLLGNPYVGVPVTFTITAGPNMSAVGTLSPADGKTDANGVVTFTYTGTAVGTDTIEASFVNSQGQTVVAQAVTATWSLTSSPPVSVDKTFYTHINTLLSVPAPGALANDADPDPDHALSAILVSTTSHGTLSLDPDGAFTYQPAQGYVGQDSFQYKATDGYDTGNVATVTITVYPRLTLGMESSTDTGTSNTDQITNNNRPTFAGTAEIGSVVTLTAQPSGGGTQVVLGSMTVGSNALWSITAGSPMADGSYSVMITEEHPGQPGRESETAALQNPVVIDTQGPRVTGVIYQPWSGQFIVTVQDELSGLNQSTVLNPASYSLIKLHTPPRYRIYVTNVTASPEGAPTDPQTVVVQVANGAKQRTGYYVIQVFAGGITDKAGNTLDGEFGGKFPSGNGTPGGKFQTLLVTHGSHVSAPRTATPLVQYLVTRKESYYAVPTVTRKVVPTVAHKVVPVVTHKAVPTVAHKMVIGKRR